MRTSIFADKEIELRISSSWKGRRISFDDTPENTNKTGRNKMEHEDTLTNRVHNSSWILPWLRIRFRISSSRHFSSITFNSPNSLVITLDDANERTDEKIRFVARAEHIACEDIYNQPLRDKWNHRFRELESELIYLKYHASGCRKRYCLISSQVDNPIKDSTDMFHVCVSIVPGLSVHSTQIPVDLATW